MSAVEITLIVVIVAVALMFALRLRPRTEHSPFTFLGVAPGMSLPQLQKAVIAERNGTVDCRKDFEVYQYCVLKYSPDPGFVSAVLDPKKRVIVVHAVTVSGLDGIHTAADSAQPSWNRAGAGVSVPPLAEIGDTGAVRWTSPDNRWTAELHFSGMSDPDAPTQVMLVDTKGVATLVAASEKGAEDAKRSGWLPPTAEEAAVAFEKRRRDRKSDYGGMATTLTMLGDYETAHWNANHRYTDNVGELPGMFIVGGTLLEILSASDSGWTAKATNPGFPGLSCVTYGGKVPAMDWPVTNTGKQITSVEGIACDPLPALATPSGGGS